MKRLFFGLEPGYETRQQCTTIMQAIDSPDNQPVPAANLHVTLVFLGLVDAAQQSALLEEAAMIPGAKLTITFNQLEYWQKPGILCLTASDASAELLMLADSLTAMAKKLAIPVDERPYLAHVTLARKAKHPVELAFEPVIWQADMFCLFESVSSENGVEYRVIKRWAMESRAG
ncbi:MAG: RNA 2',3'-cyclic phosphodiesterase [Methylovulum sp.]|nr:RNA 2',3'-cyclic phosphodiesterase [Methylovulum sp.]